MTNESYRTVTVRRPNIVYSPYQQGQGWGIIYAGNSQVQRLNNYEFVANLHNFPESLGRKCWKEFSVTCRGQNVSKLSMASNLQHHATASDLEKYFENDAITLTFRLVISCEATSNYSRKFFDPQVNRQLTLSNISNMLGDPTFSDFTFVVGKKEFKVHMNILAAASPYWHNMFTTGLEEAKKKKCTIETFTPETFEQVLRYIYCSEIPENLNVIVKPLYEAAHYYMIESLKQICEQEIHESLSKDNALEIFEWVQKYDLENLKMEAWMIIKR